MTTCCNFSFLEPALIDTFLRERNLTVDKEAVALSEFGNVAVEFSYSLSSAKFDYFVMVFIVFKVILRIILEHWWSPGPGF